mgnify:CR=1 FL=1
MARYARDVLSRDVPRETSCSRPASARAFSESSGNSVSVSGIKNTDRIDDTRRAFSAFYSNGDAHNDFYAPFRFFGRGDFAGGVDGAVNWYCRWKANAFGAIVHAHRYIVDLQ